MLYFDNASTTIVEREVAEYVRNYLLFQYSNVSSPYISAQTVSENISIYRRLTSRIINAQCNEILFTSGATESINIAIKGIAQNYSAKGKHIVTVETEHKAVLETCKYLETIGYEISYLPVNNYGIVDLGLVESVIRSDTILVCVMLVNNETGVIQPIKEISALAHYVGAFFMTDATQAFGKIEIDVNEMGIDILCLSGHKLYAPKGIGALYIRQDPYKIDIPTFIHGGGQERGIRSGTLNVPGIVGLGKACEIAMERMKDDAEKIGSLRDLLEHELLTIPGTFVNGCTKNRLYNVTNICFPDTDANVLIGRLENIAVSNGSACTSAIMQPSHVLKAMGLSDEDCFGSIRFSLGRFNTEEEIHFVIRKFKELFSMN
jgi:cysteine desulfurase